MNIPRFNQVPGLTVPGFTVPGSTLPGFTVPGSTLPGFTLPGSTVPGSTLPGFTLPGSTLPDSTIPWFNPGPESTIPGFTQDILRPETTRKTISAIAGILDDARMTYRQGSRDYIIKLVGTVPNQRTGTAIEQAAVTIPDDMIYEIAKYTDYETTNSLARVSKRVDARLTDSFYLNKIKEAPELLRPLIDNMHKRGLLWKDIYNILNRYEWQKTSLRSLGNTDYFITLTGRSFEDVFVNNDIVMFDYLANYPRLLKEYRGMIVDDTDPYEWSFYNYGLGRLPNYSRNVNINMSSYNIARINHFYNIEDEIVALSYHYQSYDILANFANHLRPAVILSDILIKLMFDKKNSSDMLVKMLTNFSEYAVIYFNNNKNDMLDYIKQAYIFDDYDLLMAFNKIFPQDVDNLLNKEMTKINKVAKLLGKN
jgi:uncharacterized protein Usg